MNKSKEQLIEEADKLWDALRESFLLIKEQVRMQSPYEYKNDKQLIRDIESMRFTANEVISLLNTTLVQNQYIK